MMPDGDACRQNAAEEEGDWSHLPPEEKNKRLFLKQKNLLDTFLAHGAISPAQYEKSLTCMAQKMGMTAYLPPEYR